MSNSKENYSKTDLELIKNNEPLFPVSNKQLRDQKFLILLASVIAGNISIACWAVIFGDPSRFSNEYDSWGNVCGRKKNLVIEGVNLSGINHSNRTFVFRMGINNLQVALHSRVYVRKYHSHPATICVHKCPEATASDCRELLKKNGYNLSRAIIENYVCTMLFDIVLPQKTEINRCIPTKLLQVRCKTFFEIRYFIH